MTDNSREQKARRMADRLGYRLTKGRPRFVGSEPGYMLLDVENGGAVYGSGSFGYAASLDEIEAWLIAEEKLNHEENVEILAKVSS